MACQAHCRRFSRVLTRRSLGPLPARRQQRLARLAEEGCWAPTLPGGATTSRIGDDARAQPVRRHRPGGPSPRLRPKAFTTGSTTIPAGLIMHEAEDPGGHRAQRLRVAWDLKAAGLGGSICGWGARSQHQAAVACQAHCGGFSRVPTRRFSGPRPARRQQRLAGLAEEGCRAPTRWRGFRLPNW